MIAHALLIRKQSHGAKQAGLFVLAKEYVDLLEDFWATPKRAIHIGFPTKTQQL